MKRLLRAALLAFAAHAGLCAAADEAGAKPAAAVDSPPAKLELGGRTITTFRAALLSYRPIDRAAGARDRLLSAYGKNPRIVFGTRHVAEGTQVLGDGAVMFMLTPGDVNALTGETPEAAAERAIGVMRKIVEERAERGDPVALLRGIGFAAVAVLLTILLLRLVFYLDRRVGIALARRVAERSRRVQVAGVSIVDQSLAARVARACVHWIAWAIAAILAFLCLDAILESLPFTRPWGEQLTGLLLDALATIGMAFLDALPGLLLVVVIFALARLATQAVAFFFDRIEERDIQVGQIDRHTAKPTRILLTLVVWIFAVAMAYPYIPGSDSRAFQGLSVLVGLMVSLGASSIVGQAAAGLILMYTRTFRVGEYVRIQDTEGTVVEIGMFVTRVRTGMGDEVMLPNNTVLANVSRNYSRGAGEPDFVITASVTIGYDTPWRQVHAMLEEAAARTTGVRGEPRPRVFQTALNDFYVAYQLSARCAAEGALARAEAQSALHAHIQDVFNEHGVQIMSPHYLGDPDRPKVGPPAKWHEPPAKPDS